MLKNRVRLFLKFSHFNLDIEVIFFRQLHFQFDAFLPTVVSKIKLLRGFSQCDQLELSFGSHCLITLVPN